MLDLYERIMELCKRKGVTLGRMSSEVGISRGMMTDLKMGRKKTINIETAVRIAEYFNVSSDYILGRFDNPTSPIPIEMSAYIGSQIRRRIQKVRQSKGLSQEDLALKINKTRDTVRGYENGPIPLTWKEMINIANALEVSLDEILNPIFDIRKDIGQNDTYVSETEKNLETIFIDGRIDKSSPELINLSDEFASLSKKEKEEALKDIKKFIEFTVSKYKKDIPDE